MPVKYYDDDDDNDDDDYYYYYYGLKKLLVASARNEAKSNRKVDFEDRKLFLIECITFQIMHTSV